MSFYRALISPIHQFFWLSIVAKSAKDIPGSNRRGPKQDMEKRRTAKYVNPKF